MRAVTAVALAVLVVAAGPLVGVAAAGTAPSTHDSGAGPTSGGLGPVGGTADHGAPNGSDNGTDPPVSVTHRYHLTTEKPGTFRFLATYRFDPNDSAVREQFAGRWITVDRNDTVVFYSGFDRVSSRAYVWDGTSEEARLAVRVDANESDEFGMSGVDTGDWAFFDTLGYTRSAVREVNGTYEQNGSAPLTTGSVWGFMGPHEVRRTAANGQGFRVVVPDAANPSASVGKLERTLHRSSRQLEVAAKDDTVTAFVVTDPMRGGGAAVDDEFWTTDPDHFIDPAPTWIHEYVHTRQEFATTGNASWTVEGFASHYAALLAWRQGESTFEEFRGAGQYRYGGRSDEILADPSTWEPYTEYTRGLLVTAALDYRIREATDGERSLADVFRRMNRRPDALNGSEFEATCEAVAGEPLDGFFDRYVSGGEFPGVPSDPSVYGFTETTHIEGSVEPTDGEPLDGMLVLSRNHVLIDPGVGTDFRKATLRNSYTTERVSGGARVSVPVETKRNYSVVFFDYSRGTTGFARNGVPDVYTVDGDVDVPSGPGSFGTERLPAAYPVEVRVVTANGTPVEAATVDFEHEDNGVRGWPTDDRGRLAVGGTTGVELTGSVAVSTFPGRQYQQQRHLQWDHNLTVTAPSEVFLAANGSDPDTGIGGSAVVGTTVAAGDTVTVVGYPYTDMWSEEQTVAVPVTVDGDRHATRNVTFEDAPHRPVQSVRFNVTFEEPGTHRVRVGSLPAHEVTVEPSDDGPGRDNDSERTRRGHLDGSDDGQSYNLSVGDDAGRVRLVLSGPRSADFDLYATTDGREPAPDDYDARSISPGSNETLVVDGDEVGDSLGVLVDSFRGEGNFTLRVVESAANASNGSGDPGAVTGHLDGLGDGDSHRIAPNGSGDHVVFGLDGPEGSDFDLYVTLDGRSPTTWDYDLASWSLDADERVVVRADRLDGLAGVLVHSWGGAGNYTLRTWRTDDPRASDDED